MSRGERTCDGTTFVIVPSSCKAIPRSSAQRSSTQKERDPETGFADGNDYFGARYYNPQSGRFMSRDPHDGNVRVPSTLHKYLYAGGDPVDAADPNGRATLLEVSLVLYFGAQRSIVTAVPVAVATCSLLELTSLVLDEKDLLKAVWTGEIESEYGNLDYFLEQADNYCKAVVPEKE